MGHDATTYEHPSDDASLMSISTFSEHAALLMNLHAMSEISNSTYELPSDFRDLQLLSMKDKAHSEPPFLIVSDSEPQNHLSKPFPAQSHNHSIQFDTRS